MADPETPAGGTPPPAADAVAAAAAAAAAANPPSQPGAAAAAVVPPGETAADPAKAATDAAAAAAAAAAAGAPEKYSLTVPEGAPLDAGDVTAFEGFARSHNLTNEQAQAALVEHATAVSGNNTRMLEQLTADPELGGANLTMAQARTNQVLDKFLPATTPEGAELRSVLTKQGLGNYLPVVRLLNNIAKAMGEDQPLNERGSAGGGGQRDAASILFPGTKT